MNLTCDRCGLPIRSWRELVVWCDSGKAQQSRREFEAWERKRTREGEDALANGDMDAWLKTVVYPLSKLPRVERAPWLVLHVDCITDEEWEWGYPIEGRRINTVRKALAWTLHLQEKVWFEYTDWDGAIRRLFTVPNP